nr:hypothetical protein [Tanacetum cinerariifolium]
TENIGNDEVNNCISNSQNDPDNRLEPRSHTESPKVEKTAEVQLVNTIEEDEESFKDDYQLKRKEKGSIDQDDPYNDAHPEGENSAKRQKTSKHGTYMFGESSSGQVNKSKPGPSTSESSSGQVNKSKPGPSTSGDEHQYHIDHMQNFLKNDIVWERRNEILGSPFIQKPTLVVQSFQRDPKPPTLLLVDQDLLCLKKGYSGPKKIILSLHKFPSVIFPDDDIKERTSRWVDRCHEHKFAREIIGRRENASIVSITELDYKNLNKNDIKDMYMWIVNGKVDDYIETGLMWSLSVFIRSTMIQELVHDFQLGVESYPQKVNLTAPTITFPGIEKYKMFSIVSKPVYGIRYKNSKKEKRVMRHQEVHKLYDATLKRVLEG